MKQLINLTVSFVLLVTVSACSLHSSQMDQAESKYPDQFTRQSDAFSGEQVQEQFWLHFQDKTLNSLIEEGFRNNFDLLMARARIEQAQQQEIIAKAPLLPFLSLKGSASTEQQLGTMGETQGDSFRLSLAAGYEIDLWDKLSSQGKGAALQVLASEEDLEALGLSAAAQITDLYYTRIEQLAQLELTERVIQSYKDNLELVERRYREGLVPTLDVYQARQNILGAQSRKPLFEERLAIVSHALSALLGRYPSFLIAEQDNPLPDINTGTSIGIPSALIQNRPDVRASYLRLMAQDERVAAAIAARFPSFTITGILGTGRLDYANVISGTFWSLLLDIAQPLFDAGRLEAEAKRQDAQFKETLAGYHKTVLRAFQEVEDGLASVQSSEKRLAILTERQKATSSTLRVALDNYSAGLTDYLNVITAQAIHFEVQSQYLAEKRQVITNWVSLMRALGSGNEKLIDQDATRPLQ